MIKINLLPYRELGKQSEIRRQLVAAILIFAVVIGGVGWFWNTQKEEINVLTVKIKRSEQELERLKTIVKKVDEAKKKKQELETKHKIIADLKDNQKGPIVVLDDISTSLTSDLWLTTLKEDGSMVEMNGYALSLEGIYAFLKNLQRSKNFATVELINSKQSNFEGQKVNQFTITLIRAKATKVKAQVSLEERRSR